MAMANNIIPITFLRMINPPLPIFLSSQLQDFKTIKTRIKFMIMPRKIFNSWYSALREIIVVIVPAPAMSGKAKGTIEVVFDPADSCLKSVIPRIISNPINKMMIAPAIANEYTSIPKRLSIDSPRNKNTIIIIPATIVALSDSILPDFFFKSITTGMEPIMSIIENNIIVTDAISLKFGMMIIFGKSNDCLLKGKR